jgi:adenylate cyclase
VLSYFVSVTRARWRADSGSRDVSVASGKTEQPSPRRVSLYYAAGLAGAHLLAVADAAAIVVPLHDRTAGGAAAYFGGKNMTIAAILVVLGAIAVAVGGATILAPVLRWYVRGDRPNPRQRRAATRLVRRQSLILAATWAASGVIFLAFNLDGGATLSIATLLAVIFGGSAAGGLSLLLTQRTLRPLLVAATQGSEGVVVAPRVLTRLMGMWLLGCGLPCAVIVALIVIRANGWIIQRTASVEMPILVVTLAAVLLGLPTMILTSRSIADPVREVVGAMAQVEQGRIDTFVGVYERSEIGRLQSGFNRMVAGIAERDRLRDLFGRHVGADVARRAVKEGTSLSGDVTEAAILFIDLVESTKLAASRPPREVAEVLNDFFRIVVSAVDERNGFINKFQGDAALAVFGVPLPSDHAASDALATARGLRNRLSQLAMVDFGIGVSAGPVFAGNIGAENRYEYTVIGDAVNEAARLADFAKTSEQRIVCSAAVLERADEDERGYWLSSGETVLRGRSEPTQVWTPARNT